MPHSKTKKHPHPHHTNTPPQLKPIKRFSRLIPAAVFIFLLFGVGIAFLAVGADIKSLIIGGIIGAVCGYFFGLQIAKGLAKK